jgi:hypothetical protein
VADQVLWTSNAVCAQLIFCARWGSGCRATAHAMSCMLLQRPCGAAEAGGGLCRGRHEAAGVMRQAVQPHTGVHMVLNSSCDHCTMRENRSEGGQMCSSTAMAVAHQQLVHCSCYAPERHAAYHRLSITVLLLHAAACAAAACVCRVRRCRGASLAAAACLLSRSATIRPSAAGRCWTTTDRCAASGLGRQARPAGGRQPR